MSENRGQSPISELQTPAAASGNRALTPVFEHRYADVNGVRLHYVTAGKGPLILFVHGFPECWFAWRRQLEEFSRDHQAVALDLRGYNLSGKPADVSQYRMKVVAEDLRQLILHLGHRKAIVVAHDWGGASAWYLAARNPEVIEKLVILNSPHPNVFERELRDNPAQQAASAYMHMFASAEGEKTLTENDYAFMMKIFGEGSHRGVRIDAETQAYYRGAWAQPGALTGGLNYYRASYVKPPRDANGASEPATTPSFDIRVPTLVIWGDRDVALLPGLLDGLDRYVPDLRIERLPKGSHWVAHEYPREVSGFIRDFIGAR